MERTAKHDRRRGGDDRVGFVCAELEVDFGVVWREGLQAGGGWPIRSRRQLGRTGVSASQADVCSCKPNLAVRPSWSMRSCFVVD